VGVCFEPNPSTCPTPVTRFVSPTGTGNGLSITTPMGSIQTAIDASSFGDTVRLLPGTYNINQRINLRGKLIKVIGHSIAPTCAIVKCLNTSTAFTIESGETLLTRLERFTITDCLKSIETGKFSSIHMESLLIKNSTGSPVAISLFGRINNCTIRDSANQVRGILDCKPPNGFGFVNVTNTNFYNNLAIFGAFSAFNFIGFLENNNFVNNSGSLASNSFFTLLIFLKALFIPILLRFP